LKYGTNRKPIGGSMSSLRVLAFLAAAATIGAATPAAHFKSPAWLSVESPVDPYDPATRDAALLFTRDSSTATRGSATCPAAPRGW
jgi:hypothetical protein